MKNDKILVLYGSSKQWVEITARDILLEYRSNGYEIREVDCKTDDVSTSFITGLFDTDPILVVLRNPSKNKKLETHLSDTGTCDVLIIHNNDRLPKALEGYLNRKLDEPPYDNEKKQWASERLIEYVEKHSKTISPKLSRAVVNRVGVDLGALRWEVIKYVHAIGEEDEITPQVVGGLISDLTEANFIDLSNAIFERNPKAFLKMCEKIERSSRTDQTMALCNGLLLSNCITFLEVGLRIDAKLKLEDISQDLNMNPYRIKKYLHPKIHSFGGTKNVRKLLHVLYRCENNVLSGGRSGWLKFKVGVLELL